MATNFSPCKGSYVLNQFPSNVMFGMNEFHVSASGAIQGHHGPLVFMNVVYLFVEPSCDERDIVVTMSVWCMCVFVRPSKFVWTITSAIEDGFKNNLT